VDSVCDPGFRVRKSNGDETMPTIHMIHIEFGHFPFAISLLPFLGYGICLPAAVYDCSRGRFTYGDAAALAIGFVIIAAWYWAILHSVRSKRRQGKQKLLGRELDAWSWSPPVAFAVGTVCGLSLLFV
jgi:hypothetical protein